jgi:hypothetical protein
MVNTTTRDSVARPCRSPLNYPDYKQDANPNVHVRVFQASIRANKIILKVLSMGIIRWGCGKYNVQRSITNLLIIEGIYHDIFKQ